MLKPIAYDVDTTVRNCANLPKKGGYGVLYKCPTCNTPLCIWLRENELFCHHCGTALLWNGVITHINSQQSDLIDDDKDGVYKTELLYHINKSNEMEKKMPTTCYIAEAE